MDVTVLVLQALLALVAPAAGWLGLRFVAPAAILAASRAVRPRWIERGLAAVAVACRGVHPVPVGVLAEVLVVVAVVA